MMEMPTAAGLLLHVLTVDVDNEQFLRSPRSLVSGCQWQMQMRCDCPVQHLSVMHSDSTTAEVQVVTEG